MSTRLKPISDDKRICVQCIRRNVKKSIKGNCLRCYYKKWKLKNPQKVKELNKKWSVINNPRRIVFKGKTISLKENPRKGQCSKCLRKIGEGIKRTLMHHIEYHEDDPLKDTIDLCASCHNKIHWNLRKRREYNIGKV